MRELYYEELRKVELVSIAYLYAKTGKTCYNGKTYSLVNITTNNFWYDRVIEKNEYYRCCSSQLYLPCSSMDCTLPGSGSAINADCLGLINQVPVYPGVENNVTPQKWVDGEGESELIDPNI